MGFLKIELGLVFQDIIILTNLKESHHHFFLRSCVSIRPSLIFKPCPEFPPIIRCSYMHIILVQFCEKKENGLGSKSHLFTTPYKCKDSSNPIVLRMRKQPLLCHTTSLFLLMITALTQCNAK